jgi:hypothetical protein
MHHKNIRGLIGNLIIRIVKQFTIELQSSKTGNFTFPEQVAIIMTNSLMFLVGKIYLWSLYVTLFEIGPYTKNK